MPKKAPGHPHSFSPGSPTSEAVTRYPNDRTCYAALSAPAARHGPTSVPCIVPQSARGFTRSSRESPHGPNSYSSHLQQFLGLPKEERTCWRIRPARTPYKAAAPGDDVRSLSYCSPASLQFPQAGREPPACPQSLHRTSDARGRTGVSRGLFRVMCDGLEHDFDGSALPLIGEVLLHLRRVSARDITLAAPRVAVKADCGFGAVQEPPHRRRLLLDLEAGDLAKRPRLTQRAG
jgi:hypothetical protein